MTPVIDFHTHILPGMDDGAQSVEMAVEMLTMLRAQGVTMVFATSHYTPHRESVESFVARREEAYARLMKHLGSDRFPEIRLGAEIYIEKGISERDLRPLYLEGTKALLMEFPREPFRDWMTGEVENVMYSQPATPVIAHLDRYLSWFRRAEIEAVLSLEDTVFQINAEAFADRAGKKFVYELYKQGVPLVFGSDAHNTAGRAPQMQRIADAARKKKIPWMNYAGETAGRYGLLGGDNPIAFSR